MPAPELFAEHVRAYAATLPARLVELEGAIVAAREGTVAADEARSLAHRLRGSAGSFGYPGVGVWAGKIEDLLAPSRDGTSIPHDAWTHIDAFLLEVRAAASLLPPASEPRSPERRTTSTVLVVDDDREFLTLVRQLARRFSVEVVTADDPEQALLRAGEQRLLGAILDVHLRDCTSFDLAKRIRDVARNPGMPVTFVSAGGDVETRVAAIEAGGTKFFDKPLTRESFGTILEQFAVQAVALRGRVLIVDDDPDLTEYYRRLLTAADIHTETLSAPDQLIAKLEDSRPDVLLLDVNLPRVSGLDVCRALHQSERWDLLPILVVTARTDDDTRLAAFRAGAADVITKPVLPEELLARVQVQLDRVRLTRDRVERDSLSGLLLRRSFVDALERALAECTRHGRPLAFALIDLDNFKQINDRHGHLAGDQVIVRFGELLRRRFRTEDLRGRWGGEEFVLAFPGQDVSFAGEAPQRLLKDFGELRFRSESGETFQATFTAGVACFPDDATTLTGLVQCADVRLYEGKRQGRNRVCVVA